MAKITSGTMVSFRATAAEARQLTAAADAMGISRSEFIRSAATKAAARMMVNPGMQSPVFVHHGSERTVLHWAFGDWSLSSSNTPVNEEGLPIKW